MSEKKIINELREWSRDHEKKSGCDRDGALKALVHYALRDKLTELEQKYCNGKEIVDSSDHIPSVRKMVEPRFKLGDSVKADSDNSIFRIISIRHALNYSFVYYGDGYSNDEYLEEDLELVEEKPQANTYEIKIRRDLLYFDKTIEIDAFGNEVKESTKPQTDD